MESNVKRLNELRNSLDKIDDEILRLISKRNKIIRKVGLVKKKLNLSLHDPKREEEIIQRLKKKFPEVNKSLIKTIFNIIFFVSKSQQLKNSSMKRGNLLKTLIRSKPLIIAGPCAVESEDQILRIAKKLSFMDIKLLRGGVFKPRTSPKSFQGLGFNGLIHMRKAANKYNMFVVTEVMDAYQLDLCYDLIDVIQIGSRNMSSYSFLKYVGKRTAKDQKPVLLKRGFASTLKELLCAAEYIIKSGNPNVILCLRGIRTFEQLDSDMRNTSDLSAILELKMKTKLPVIFDPSHSTGNSKYVLDISKAALQLGADGLIIECHDQPEKALVDGKQSVNPSQLRELIYFIEKLVQVRK